MAGRRNDVPAVKVAWATEMQDFIFESARKIRARGEELAHLAFLYRFPKTDPVFLRVGGRKVQGVIPQGPLDTEMWAAVIRSATRESKAQMVVIITEAWGVSREVQGSEEVDLADDFKQAGGSLKDYPGRQEIISCTAITRWGMSRFLGCPVDQLDKVDDSGWMEKMGGVLSEVF